MPVQACVSLEYPVYHPATLTVLPAGVVVHQTEIVFHVPAVHGFNLLVEE